jgi:hypothetical protein
MTTAIGGGFLSLIKKQIAPAIFRIRKQTPPFMVIDIATKIEAR